MRADHDQHPSLPAVPRRLAVGLVVAGIALMPTLVGGVAGVPVASAALASVDLGTAKSFAVLAGAGVTNTGLSVLGGDLGTCPVPAVTGFPPGVVNGTQHVNDEVACQAKSDLTIAYDSAAGRAPTTTYPGPTDLSGLTLTTGVYTSAVSFALTGTLTLDAKDDPSAVFIFQTGSSTLITADNSVVDLVNGAQACNVFWQVGSSATLGVDSTFVGTVLALASITGNTDATVDGRLLARTGAVTLDSNTVTVPVCATGGSTSSEPDASSSSSTLPDSSSSTLPDASSSSTTSSPPMDSSSSTSSTTTPAASTPSTRDDGVVVGPTSTSRPVSEVLGVVVGAPPNGTAPTPAGTLPRTGFPLGSTVIAALAAIALGTAATRFSRA
ncbi:MAG TPA: ice-binding family protein [Acidimicrobiia bacterium]|nr:ice-binding family protein [Acidimicrobiia bacterium]